MKLNKKLKNISIIVTTSLVVGFLNIGYTRYNNISCINIVNASSNITYNKTTFKEVSVGSGKTACVRSSGTVYEDNILGKLKHGEVVEVIRETTNWYRVKKGSLEGWVAKKEMKDTTKKANIKHWYYKGNETNITIDKIRKYNSDIYIARVKIKNAMQFKHVYASKTIDSLDTVQNMTSKYSPILAINASGFSRSSEPTGTVGSVGKIDRLIPGRTSLVLGYDGNLNVKNAKSNSELENLNPFWVASFGPTLVNNYRNVQVNPKNDKKEPRMAIGQTENPNEFIIIAVDGRVPGKTEGVTLKELAALFENEGCRVAYNLDGGGSATMVFDGYIINKPSDSSGARKVLDSIFIRNIR